MGSLVLGGMEMCVRSVHHSFLGSGVRIVRWQQSPRIDQGGGILSGKLPHRGVCEDLVK